MIRSDAIVVGGGPAGSTCARTLSRAGWKVVVIDRARFPRDKVCAGWVTPGAFAALELEPDAYRQAGLVLQEIRGFRTGVMGRPLLDTDYQRVVSYAVRRCEFDTHLLHRSGARVIDGMPVGTLERTRTGWTVNGSISAPVLIGAGGHFCPVARFVQGGSDAQQPVVAQEAEARYDGDFAIAGEKPELFFCRDLQGYAWCVRKDRYLNVGIGRRSPAEFLRHVREFAAFLQGELRLRLNALKWRGHAYFARGVGPRPIVADGILIVGDAAGLAYPESGEGICPAIESGRTAAETLIAADGKHDVGSLAPYVELLRRQHPPARPYPAPLQSAAAAIGRVLLGSPAFTRQVLLNRWFLRV